MTTPFGTSDFSRRALFGILPLLFAAFAFVAAGAAHADEAASAEDPSPYRVVWDSPSEDWFGSMPLGNGEVCVNAWFESVARVQLLFARTDSWDDYGQLAKVGSVEIAFLGDDFVPELATPFRQELDVRTGVVSVAFGPEGKETRVKLWVETNRPNVVVEIDSDLEVAPRARLRLWRHEKKTLTGPEISDLWWKGNAGESIELYPDAVVAPESLSANRVGVYHRNVKTPYYDEIAKTQGLDESPLFAPDPYVDRTFGLILSGDDVQRKDAESLQTRPGRARRFEIAVHTAQTPTVQEWLDQAVAIADSAAAEPVDARRDAAIRYWREFDRRSWLRFSPNEKALADATPEERAAVAAETFDVTRACALQRYLFACQGRGAYPIKFNGGLFTVAEPGKVMSHDYRRWGPGYWWQNTRHAYYGMNESGDFELEDAFFRAYCSLVPICEYRTKKYLGVDGAYFPECVYLNGAVFPETYGLQPWNEREDKLQASRWHKWEWVGGLELAFMAIRYYEFTLDETFLSERAIPTANAVLRFFDSFYKVDPETGKLKMTPSQSLETWWECENPTPEIAGIRAVTERLLALPEEKTTPEDRAFWRALLDKTPEVPTRFDEASGKTVLAAAGSFAQMANIETPELYPVFPFRLYSFEKPHAEYARDAFAIRLNRYCTGWAQDDVFSAYLGDAQSAREMLVTRARARNPQSRFPAFWGPNWDWNPDQNHGGVLMTAAHSLVLQSDGDAIYLAPALPEAWNVEFKLWAPKRTTLQGRIVDGTVETLEVEPKEREKDVRAIGR